MPKTKRKPEDQMRGLPTRAEVDANVRRYIAQAIADYDRRRSPAAYWFWPARWVGAAVRDCACAIVGVFVELWRRARG